MRHVESQVGFTLIELLIAVGIFTIALLSVGFSILSISDLSELSREKIAATADANRVLEAMRDTANNSLTTLKSTDWNLWATNNVINGKGTNEIQLNQENIVTTFPNPSNDPVQVSLTVNWWHKQRPYSYQITTLMADRT